MTVGTFLGAVVSLAFMAESEEVCILVAREVIIR